MIISVDEIDEMFRRCAKALDDLEGVLAERHLI